MELMIVESPSKAKAINKYLAGTGIKVMASIGHVRGLDTSIKNAGAVEPEHGFKMHYILNEKNKPNTKELLTTAKRVNVVYLATDPDRSGHNIAWHLRELIKKVNPKCEFRRVTYHEVNEKAIKKALKEYKDLEMPLVEADFARQALDYLVGFHVSPILWKRVSPGLSAGRVQSPALRILATREQEIKNFIPMAYWNLSLLTSKDNTDFTVKLISIDGKKLGKFHFTEQKEANLHKNHIDGLVSKEKLHVVDLKTSKQSRKPKPPYTTSTLQMDGVRKLGWSAKRVMDAAQKLFEGEGDHGFITYHRTDSTNFSEEALSMIYGYAKANYTKEVEDHPKTYASKAKNAQEAHEAIRPTDIAITPGSLSSKLSDDAKKLYDLIWRRTVATQLKPALFDQTQVNLNLTKQYGFRANGSVLVFKGYLAVYKEGEEIDGEKEDTVSLPQLYTGDKLDVKKIDLSQHETKPPARFNEASLVKVLEEYGIGRPSTYASIPKTLLERGYIKVDSNRITVTDICMAVTEYLIDHFTEYVDYGFTAKLEEELDDISNSKENWVTVLYKFWKPFKKVVDKELLEVKGFGKAEQTNQVCPNCNKANLDKKLGKYGYYLDCPECKYKVSLTPKEEPKYFEGKVCPKCQGRLRVLKSKFGEFLSCEHNGKKGSCDYTCLRDGSEKPEGPLNTKVKCPECKADIVVRNSRRGKFFACSGFPKHKKIFTLDEFMNLSKLTLVEVEDLLK